MQRGLEYLQSHGNYCKPCIYFGNSHLMGAMIAWFPTCVLPMSYLRLTDVFIRVATFNGVFLASDMQVDNYVRCQIRDCLASARYQE